MNIHGLCVNFVDCEPFLEPNSTDSLALCETLLDDSMILAISLSGVMFCYSYAWAGSLCEGRTSLCMGLTSRRMFFTGFTSFSDLLLFPLSIISLVFMHGF